MYVLAGLGNPGEKYAQTRHNMGFLTVDHLAEKLGIKINKMKCKALVGETRLFDQKIFLVKPQTYMNRSGDSIRELVEYYKVAHDHLMIVYDDLDLDVGVVRIRKKGSAGTHNGMRSVIARLGYDDFPRIRLGIGNNGTTDIIHYVLGGFSRQEVAPLERAVEAACQAMITLVKDGIDRAMQEYNGRY